METLQAEESKINFIISSKAFAWTRFVAITLSLSWAGIFGYLEADALNYSILAKTIFDHFTIENVMLFFIALIFGLLPFAVSIRFGDSRLCKKSIVSVFQVVCISILFEDIAYFASLGTLIKPQDWTSAIFGGLYIPASFLFQFSLFKHLTI